jgi:cbb3-type cytochrome c oxidase subunit III
MQKSDWDSRKYSHKRLIRSFTQLFLLSGLTLLLPTSTIAKGDPGDGQTKALTCSACHGQDGNSINPEWPNLAGQHEKYIVKALRSYKDGTRNVVLMASQVASLSNQDMDDVAAFFSSQTVARQTANPALVKQGERIYRGGDMNRGISACIACHGPTGRGNQAAGFPALAGQHATYTANQLLAYRANTRQTDADVGQVMRNVSALLSEAEIKAVASYIQGLQ